MNDTFKINRELALNRGLTENDIVVIASIMKRLHSVLNRPLYYFNSYKDAVHYVESVEIVLQDLWRFPYNPDYQTYRFSFKDCTCPKMDNYDNIGTGKWYYNTECPVHNHLVERFK